MSRTELARADLLRWILLSEPTLIDDEAERMLPQEVPDAAKVRSQDSAQFTSHSTPQRHVSTS